MAAIYPVAVRAYTEKMDYTELVDAQDVNELQDEVGAIEQTLGTNPHVYKAAGAAATTYKTVGARLDSHEASLANQQSEINTILAASKVGWATPALTVTGSVFPGIRTILPDLGPAPVIWTSSSTDIGDMFIAGASVISIPLGGRWKIRAMGNSPVDWPNLNAAQTTNNHLGVLPIPIAFQRLMLTLYINGVQVAANYDERRWYPLALSGGNPPVGYPVSPFQPCLDWTGTLTSGMQLQLKAEQWYGAMPSASVTMSVDFDKSIPGVD